MLKVLGIIIVISSILQAEPTSGKVKLNYIRSYHSSDNAIFIEVSNSAFMQYKCF